MKPLKPHKNKRGLVYANIYWYRALMQLIYGGKYLQRFAPIIKNFPPTCKSVVELCFGDLVIAEHCLANQINWMGFDINEAFVGNALKKGHTAFLEDIMEPGDFPEADLLVIAGSLYHFHGQLPALFLKMTRAAGYIIISEPVKNLSSMNGPLGWLARKATNAGKGEEPFRFTKESLLAAINSIECIREGYGIKVLHQNRDLIIAIWRK